jgi:hypothetical protein
MTVYISGAVTGIPNRNKKAFGEAYADIARLKRHPQLRDMKIINPLRIGTKVDKAFAAQGAEPAWVDYMRECVKRLCDADCAYFLKGWDMSDGANVERYIAKRLSIPCADNLEELKRILKEKTEGKNEN